MAVHREIEKGGGKRTPHDSRGLMHSWRHSSRFSHLTFPQRPEVALWRVRVLFLYALKGYL